MDAATMRGMPDLERGKRRYEEEQARLRSLSREELEAEALGWMMAAWNDRAGGEDLDAAEYYERVLRPTLSEKP